MNLVQLSPFPEKDLLRVIVETPRGSRNKFDYDPKDKVFILAKVLPQGLVFPYDFGFIPQTVGEDGDPLDVLMLIPESVHTGCVVDCRLLGVIRGEQKERNGKTVRNDRFLAATSSAREYDKLSRPQDLPAAVLDQLQEFFLTYNRLAGKTFKPLGVEGPKAALKLIKVGRSKYRHGE